MLRASTMHTMQSMQGHASMLQHVPFAPFLQWAASSVYYLLGLWSRLVSSMPYLKGDSPSLLETNVPAITQAYITSRWVPACGWECNLVHQGQRCAQGLLRASALMQCRCVGMGFSHRQRQSCLHLFASSVGMSEFLCGPLTSPQPIHQTSCCTVHTHKYFTCRP